ncbi:MAG: MFS transporter [Bacteroidetes bacterium]|nr:MAG: MFS transporter [Bacteroidota bacterium]
MISYTAQLYRNAYSGLSRPTWLLSLVMLINRSGTMVVPFMTIYLTSPQMGYSIGKAGFVMALFGLGAMAGGFFGGRLTDKFGFYPVQIFTLSGGGILFILLGLMKSFPLICIFTFTLSLVNEAFRPANSTAIAFYSLEDNRTRSYSLNRLAINLGWAVGGALGGILAKFSYSLLFWVDGLTNIMAAVLMWRFLKAAAEKHVVHPKAVRDASASPYRDRTYLMFIFLVILFATCFFQLFTTLSAYFKNELNFSEPFIGLLMAINGLLIVAIEMILVFKLEGRRKNTYFIARGVILIGSFYFLLNVFHLKEWMAILGMVIITAGEILSMPFMNSYWITRTNTYNRGQYAGLYTIAWSVAQTLAPLLGGLLAEHHGYATLWWCVAGLSFLVFLGFKALF